KMSLHPRHPQLCRISLRSMVSTVMGSIFAVLHQGKELVLDLLWIQRGLVLQGRIDEELQGACVPADAVMANARVVVTVETCIRLDFGMEDVMTNHEVVRAELAQAV